MSARQKLKQIPELVAILQKALEEAESGQMRDLFIWYRNKGDEPDYAYLVADLDDLLFELRSVIIKERSTPRD